MKTVLLVCTGNTCRSAMAAAVLRHLLARRQLRRITVCSAGLMAMPGDTMPSPARQALAQAGIAAGDHRARLLDAEAVAAADCIVTMTKQHAHDILEQFPEAASKTHTLLSFAGFTADVSDPIGGSIERYAHCLQAMTPALDALIRFLVKEKAPAAGEPDRKKRDA
ncbi:MAG: low molecular weight protein arginine phosphatase [Lentisphaeria bacterium]